MQPQLQPGAVQRAGQGAGQRRRGERDDNAAVTAAAALLRQGLGGVFAAAPGVGGEEQQAALHLPGQGQGAQRALTVQAVGGADGRDVTGDIVLWAAGEI